jgi:zinc ribbon protein
VTGECPACGSANRAGARFCRSCGGVLGRTVAATERPLGPSRSARAEVHTTAPIEAPDVPVGPTETLEPPRASPLRRRRLTLLPALGAIVVAVAVTLAVVLMTRGDDGVGVAAAAGSRVRSAPALASSLLATLRTSTRLRVDCSVTEAATGIAWARVAEPAEAGGRHIAGGYVASGLLSPRPSVPHC